VATVEGWAVVVVIMAVVPIKVVVGGGQLATA
jgi:hypothetical protein